MTVAWPKFKPWRLVKFDSPTNAGSRFKKKYSASYNKEGILELHETGIEDVYEYIQSFADEVDLNKILQQFRATGDVSLLSRAQGFYMDASELPETWPDILNVVDNVKNEFEKMPPEFKENYGNDFAQFLANYKPVDTSNLVVDTSGFVANPEVHESNVEEKEA